MATTKNGNIKTVMNSPAGKAPSMSGSSIPAASDSFKGHKVVHTISKDEVRGGKK